MRRLALIALAVTGLLVPVTARSAPRSGSGLAPLPRGEVRVIATVPAPGDPALPLVWGGQIWEGTYTSATGSAAHSHVFAFSPDGRLVHDFTVADQPAQPYGVQVANVTADGRLVVLDDTSGRVLLVNRHTGARRLYATIPDIPLCSDAGASTECSQAQTEQPPEPDYAAWGTDGSLYVTDYQQAVIWRIPPGGGTPSIWLSSPDLDGEQFGTAGIVLAPDHRSFLVDQASNLGSSTQPMGTGKLFRIPILPSGAPGTPTLLWSTPATALVDGFALARSGDIYLAQIGPTGNDIIELSPDGTVLATFGTPITGANGSPIPFDEPSGVAFFGSDLIVANQSYVAGDTGHMALLALGTGERGLPVYVSRFAGTVRGRGGRAHH